MEEDDDAFLYGGEAEGTKTEHGKVEPTDASQEPAGKVDQGEGEGDEEEDEEDEEDSDSDLEIIVDGSAGPPAGYNARPAAPAAPIRPAPGQRPAQSAITSDYTPNARPGQSNAASALASITGIDTSTPPPAVVAVTGKVGGAPQANEYTSLNQLPEGPPPPVPITAPRLDLDPSEQSLLLPPETVDGEPGPLIYHVDPSEFEEKPWRRPGADLTDWFNYGFNEESWKVWGEKKHNSTKDRIEMETNGGRHDASRAVGEEQHAEQQQQQHQHDNSSSNFMSQVPPQQMQVMQAMIGASGLSMSPEQMMAFMGMGAGGGMPGMGMSGAGGPMMGMPGMGGMFGGGQSNANAGMFHNNFPGMPNMPMMHQPPFQQQRGTPTNGGQFDESSEAGVRSGGDNEQQQQQHHGDNNGNGEESLEGDGHGQTNATDNADEGSQGARGAKVGMSIQGRGAGVPGAPTGPSRGGAAPQSKAPLPSNVPTGPKNPGRRYNDRDTGLGPADSLDYGGGLGGNREDADGRSPVVQRNMPRSPEGRSSSLRRQKSHESREQSTEREWERERERDYHDDGATRPARRARDRTGERKRQSSTDDELERLSKRDQPSSRRQEQRHNSSSTRRGDYREDRRPGDSVERDEEWERDSVASSTTRRRPSSRQRGQGGEQPSSRRSSGRSERRKGGEGDSGEETERERRHDRSQMRAERRAGRDGGGVDDKASNRKRNAPDDDVSPVRSSSSRKRR